MLVAAVKSTKPFFPGSLTRTVPFSATAVARFPTTGGSTTGPGGGVVTAPVSDEVETWNGPAPPAGFVTPASVTVTASPGPIESLQQSGTVSVAFAFERVPDRVNVAPVVSSRICATAGRTVPAGAAIVIVPGATSPPVELGVNENESLTLPLASVVAVTAVRPVTCWGALSE